VFGGQDRYGRVQIGKGLAQLRDLGFRAVGLDADFLAAFAQH
jgi:hypothetical protein